MAIPITTPKYISFSLNFIDSMLISSLGLYNAKYCSKKSL